MNKNCMVNQRELHADTKTFTDAASRASRRSRRRADRRNARPGNHRVGAAHRRNRPLDVSALCTPTRLLRRSTESSTCFPPTSSRKFGPSCPWCSKASCAKACCRRRTAKAGPWRWRSWCRTRRYAISFAKTRFTRFTLPCNPGRTSSACRPLTSRWQRLVLPETDFSRSGYGALEQPGRIAGNDQSGCHLTNPDPAGARSPRVRHTEASDSRAVRFFPPETWVFRREQQAFRSRV
jgi:hypothetical protein